MRRVRRELGSTRAVIGLALLLVLALAGLLAPLIAPHSPTAISASRVLKGPDLSHPLGSDALGRDVLSRLLFAFRTSLGIAAGSVALALAGGTLLGLLAGYFRGLLDALLMRTLDMLLALPALLLAIALIAIAGPGIWIVILAIALIYLPIFARIVRSTVVRVSGEPYVEASRARGASHLAVLRGHVLPNSFGPAIVQASVLAGFAFQLEAALSFLGLGVQPPTPSLGTMLYDGYQVLQQAWWADVFPGLAIGLAVAGFLLLGDGLRRRLDPRGIAA
jgi:peptide/nickel transport system permease protein